MAHCDETDCPQCSEICPLCKQNGVSKVLYYGFPMKLCDNQDCNCVTGFWQWIHNFHFDGFFIGYTGSYFSGLWFWLSGKARYTCEDTK